MPKGSRKHLKRLAAPGHLPIQRKSRPFTIRPYPGAHRHTECIPLGVIIRDYLKVTTTLTETRRVIAKGLVKVDGRVRKDYKFAVGLMDVIEVPEIKIQQRVVPSTRHLLQLHKITKKEAGVKLCKITGKTTVAKGNIQLHLHDGRNILLPSEDPKAKPKEAYQVGGTLLIQLPTQKIMDHIPLKEGIMAVITGGDHTGFVGKLMKIDSKTKLGTLQSAQEKSILTAMRYVFPIGRDDSLISIPKAE